MISLQQHTAGAHGLTRSQQGVLHAQLIDPTSNDFTVGEAVELRGDVEVSLLVRAIEDSVAAAPGWDMRVDDCGAVSAGDGNVDCPVVDFTTDSDPWHAALDHMVARLDQGVRFGPDPLHAHEVLLLGADRVVWFVRAHHVLVDGYGLVLLVRDALNRYAADRTGEACPDSRLTDSSPVVAAERAYEESAAHERDRSHWMEALARIDAVGAVHGIAPTGAGAGTFSVTAAELDRAAEKLEVTWPDLVAAAQGVVMSRLAKSSDVVIGIPLMNRMGRAALTPTSVVNILPLHLGVRPQDTVADHVREVAARFSALKRHGRFRVEELAGLRGDVADVTPLMGAELNIKVFDQPAHVAGVDVTIHSLAEGPSDDFECAVHRRDGVLSWRVSSPGARVGEDHGTAPAIARLIDAVLTDMVRGNSDARVGQLGRHVAEPHPDGERDIWAVDADAALAPDLFAEAVSQYPHRLAVVDAEESVTYAELDRRVRTMAGHLLRTTGEGDRIAVQTPRGLLGVAGLLACLCTGRVAVPVDPTWPVARREEIHRSAGVTMVLEADEWASVLATEPLEAELPSVSPDAVAYVIHTSGSTGRPKGVAITHEAFARFLAHHRRHTYGTLPSPVRIAQTLPFEFDGSWDTLGGIFSGHEIHVLPLETTRDPAATVAAVRAAGLGFVDTTPTMMTALLQEGLLDAGHRLQHVSVGGEACPPQLWERLTSEPGLRVANFYGPTEVTVDAVGLVIQGRPEAEQTHPETARDRGTIGSPLTSVGFRILDGHLQTVPNGVIGELYLTGPQLAAGYLDRPGLTAERFVADPHGPPGARMYRTGDLVSVGPDGLIDYHGRDDAQVKVRGFRVEPAEVEAVLGSIRGVRHAVVLVHGGRLLGFVTGECLRADAVRGAAAELLPAHLVPSRVTVVDDIPRTGNGKLDITALLDTAMSSAEDPAEVDAPAVLHGDRERLVAAEVCRVLAVAESEVGSTTDFFAMGGDSIAAISLVSSLRDRGHRSSVAQVFTERTVAGIAAGLIPLADEAPPTDDPGRGASPDLDLDQTQLDAIDALLNRRRAPHGRTS